LRKTENYLRLREPINLSASVGQFIGESNDTTRTQKL
jgi:hypothetical protein